MPASLSILSQAPSEVTSALMLEETLFMDLIQSSLLKRKLLFGSNQRSLFHGLTTLNNRFTFKIKEILKISWMDFLNLSKKKKD
jgi:hypothetical protein